MAKSTAAPTEGGEIAASSPGLLGLIIALLVATVVAGVGGGIFGMYVSGSAQRPPEKTAEPPAGQPKPRFSEPINLQQLSPIVTNLAAPKDAWIRLEAAIAVDRAAAQDENLLISRISEDVVAFLRTVSLTQIEGANGFQNLREDLNDRVRIRSGGSVRELIIQSMIVE